MANNFNDNANKKNLNGSDISYTTYRTNYSNDEMMKDNGGVPSSGGGSGFTKLYAWNYESQYLYTTSENPSAGDTAFGVRVEHATYLESVIIDSVGENTITYNDDAFERNSTDDINL